VLALGEPTPDALAAMQRVLEEEDAFPDLWHTYRAERAEVHDLVRAVEAGQVPLNRALVRASIPAEGLVQTFLQPSFKSEHATILSVMTRHVDATRLPLHEQGVVHYALDAEVREMPMRAILTRTHLSHMGGLVESSRHKHGLLRCLIVGLAAERYRRRHGAWPAAAADLVPAELAAVPLGPYDGLPIRFRSLADGAVAYTFEPDTIPYSQRQVALSLPSKSEFDFGCRLWNPDCRARPAAAADGGQP
jgi:hypothetical protein